MKLVQVNLMPFGAYFLYSLPVKRGIRGKTKAVVDELIVHGIPKEKLQDFCINNDIQITNKAVYVNGEKVLIADGKGNYYDDCNNL